MSTNRKGTTGDWIEQFVLERSVKLLHALILSC